MDFKNFIYLKCLGAWSKSWRITVDGTDILDRQLYNGDSYLACFWHGKLVPVFKAFETYPVMIITTASDRGDKIQLIGEKFGHSAVAIDSQDPRKASRELEAVFQENKVLGLAVDGPLGPNQRSKKRLIQIASKYNFKILPILVDMKYKYTIKNRWDNLEVPLLFCNINIKVKDPIPLPQNLTIRDAKFWSSNLDNQLKL